MISHADAISLLDKWRVEGTPVKVLLNAGEATASFVGRIVELDTGVVEFRPTDPNPSDVHTRVNLSAATFEWGDRRELGARFLKAWERFEDVARGLPRLESFLTIFLSSGAGVCVAELGEYNHGRERPT